MATFLQLHDDQVLPLAGTRIRTTPMPGAKVEFDTGDGRNVEVIINVPSQIEAASGRRREVRDHLGYVRWLASLVDPRIDEAIARRSGQLELTINGSRFRVPAQGAEAWWVVVDGMTWVPLPGGGLAAWLPERSPSDEANDIVGVYLKGMRDAGSAGFWSDDVDGAILFAREAPDQMWPIVVDLVRRTCDDHELFRVAAGPLEDLLNKYGEVFIDRAEAEASHDPKFRRALAGVWLSPREGPVWDRVQAALSARDVAETE